MAVNLSVEGNDTDYCLLILFSYSDFSFYSTHGYIHVIYKNRINKQNISNTAATNTFRRTTE